jgi:hypothetical protein
LSEITTIKVDKKLSSKLKLLSESRNRKEGRGKIIDMLFEYYISENAIYTDNGYMFPGDKVIINGLSKGEGDEIEPEIFVGFADIDGCRHACFDNGISVSASSGSLYWSKIIKRRGEI